MRTMTSRRIFTLALLVVAVVGLVGLFTPAQTYAQETGLVQCSSALPGTTLPEGAPPPCDFCQAVELTNNVVNIAGGALLGLSVLMLVIAGFLYVTAAGNPKLVEQAKDALKFAIAGIILVTLSFLLVQLILRAALGDQASNKPIFGGFDCNPAALQPGGTTNGGGTTDGEPGDGGSGFITCDEQPNCIKQDSPALAQFISCFTTKMNEEGIIVGSVFTWQDEHNPNSCHFGGATCTDGSHAVDFGGRGGNEQSWTAGEAQFILRFTKECGLDKAPRPENNLGQNTGSIEDPKTTHIHINVDNERCGCS